MDSLDQAPEAFGLQEQRPAENENGEVSNLDNVQGVRKDETRKVKRTLYLYDESEVVTEKASLIS